MHWVSAHCLIRSSSHSYIHSPILRCCACAQIHRCHDLDYMLCVIEGESIDADFAGGKSIRLPMEPGSFLFVPRGNTETAVNRSEKRYRELLIELKG